jgi:G patch domain-containing protein 1
VGYVNDDDDDDDPYGSTNASSSSLAFAFDNAAEQNDDVIVMGEIAKPDRSQAGAPRKSGSTDTWHDGRPVLPGFVLDPLGVPTDKW